MSAWKWKPSFLNYSNYMPKLVPIWHCHNIWHNIMLVLWKDRWTFCMTSSKKHFSFFLLSAQCSLILLWLSSQCSLKVEVKVFPHPKCPLRSSSFFFWPTSSLPRYMLHSLYSIRSDRNSFHVIWFFPRNGHNQTIQVKEFFGPHESLHDALCKNATFNNALRTTFGVCPS